jgi:hypothetical protein
MRTTVLLTIMATLACTSALAQTSDSRRRIFPTQDGFLEIDPRTGAISECKRAQDGYRCERVTQGDALLKEEGTPHAQAPAVPTPPRTERRSSGPTDEEIDQALDVMERFLRRFMGIMREERGERT